MKRLVFIAMLALTACANPSVVRVKSDQISAAGITKVFVPRFEGDPSYVEESTDFFVTNLESRIRAQVIQGSGLRTEGADILAGGNLVDVDIAIAKAKQLGAQVVILGKVTSTYSGSTLNGFSTVRIINVADGTVLASFHRPSGMLIAHSPHHAVMKAVERTAEDAAGALK